MTARVFSINISANKGEAKNMVRQAILVENSGLEGDAHAGPGLRQVSLLAVESIEAAESSCPEADMDLRPGIFGENITTEGVDLSKLKPNDRILIGESVVLQVRQKGKDCPEPCRIGQQLGTCIMPHLGIFASVERGGEIRVHDKIRVPSCAPSLFGFKRSSEPWKT